MNADLQQLIAALPHDDSADDDAAALALVSQRAIPTGRLARLWTLGTIQAQIAAAYAEHLVELARNHLNRPDVAAWPASSSSLPSL